MQKLRIYLFSTLIALCLCSCGPSIKGGPGYFIARLDGIRVGDPVFSEIEPQYGATTYLDRNAGLVFISAEKFRTLEGVRMVEAGSQPYPKVLPFRSVGMQAAVKLVECKQLGNCASINICGRSFLIRAKDPVEIYGAMQLRAFPIASLTYVGQGSETFRVDISYFSDCDAIAADLEMVLGKENIISS